MKKYECGTRMTLDRPRIQPRGKMKNNFEIKK